MTSQPTLPIPANDLRAPHPEGTGYLPAWVTQQLEENRQTLLANTARYQHCPDCQAITLAGMDHPRCGQPVRVDPTPLTAELEAACLLVDRPTYHAWRATGGYQLQARDQWNRNGRPPRTPVLPEHKCGARFEGFLEPPEPDDPTRDPNHLPF